MQLVWPASCSWLPHLRQNELVNENISVSLSLYWFFWPDGVLAEGAETKANATSSWAASSRWPSTFSTLWFPLKSVLVFSWYRVTLWKTYGYRLSFKTCSTHLLQMGDVNHSLNQPDVPDTLAMALNAAAVLWSHHKCGRLRWGHRSGRRREKRLAIESEKERERKKEANSWGKWHIVKRGDGVPVRRRTSPAPRRRSGLCGPEPQSWSIVARWSQRRAHAGWM